jgi:hypothetical protein
VRGRLSRQGTRDRLKHAVDIPKHIVIPKTQDAISMIGQPPIAPDIVFAVRMLATIHLDNQPPFTTSKIHSKWPDRLLTNEFQSIELP